MSFGLPMSRRREKEGREKRAREKGKKEEVDGGAKGGACV